MAEPREALNFTYVADDTAEVASSAELKLSLEKGSDEAKLDALRRLIISTLNGQSQPNLLMDTIRFALPSKNKQIKKLLHFYWEVCPKYDDATGKLKQEMILVCNAIRNDLQHPNEYIRGATLRFLQKIREPELLEPLVPTCRACLEHRHSYVRKNAVFAVWQIYKTSEALVPDAAELIQTFLAAETDAVCRRNAFITLVHIAPQRAIDYFLSVYEGVGALDELMQLAVIELVRTDLKDSKGEPPAQKPRYVRVVFELLNSTSSAVKYEAASILTSLTQNPAAIKAAASCYIDLIVRESDNNVKLIVLERVDALRSKHEHVLDDLVMDVLRVLSATDMEVRRKAIAIGLDMVSSRNVEEVVLLLKKELVKTLDAQYEKNPEYRQLLIQSIHSCAIKFSEVAANVVHVLMEFLGDAANTSAVDVIAFVREVVERFPDLRSSIVEKLLGTFGDIKSGKVFRGALWICGEYCSSEQDIKDVMQQIRKVVGEIPILAAEQRLHEQHYAEVAAAADANATPATKGPITTTKVLADGTYATETVYSTNNSASLSAVKAAAKPPLRALILGGDFYTASVLASTLTKLTLHLASLSSDARAVNDLRAESILVMTSILRVGDSPFVAAPIDEDSAERITTCLQSLSELRADGPAAASVKHVFLEDTQAAYAGMVAHGEQKAAAQKAQASKATAVQADDLISFRQFAKRAGDTPDEYEEALSKATGAATASDDFISKLQRVVQLTGFSDPVYAEAYVQVHQFDINLDVLIVNQTTDTLQNLTVEFATLGDLKISERPSPHTLGPHSFQSIKTTVKVSSTETGVIFGSIFYDRGPLSNDSRAVVLADVHIDILDYIKPASCNEAQFRSMWTEFEWENKVNVNSHLTDLREYLAHVMASTNMACLTPDAALSGDCGFLSANMYARSLFGEDALANISIEKVDGVLQGHVRIRSKTQGIALSLGDRITTSQRAAAA